MSDTIKLKGVVMEDFANYKVPSLFLITSMCDWKCCTEKCMDISICQNSDLAQAETRDYKIESIFNAYVNNPITKAIVIGGLEPFLQFDEIRELIHYFRWNECFDPFVIYTGYYPEEIDHKIFCLQKYDNIIVKFGRYIPNHNQHFDEVLGINLASDNQYGEKIS